MSELATRRSPLDLDVGPAGPGDRRAIIEMLVRAFDDDPFANWFILQDRRRAWRFRRCFEAMYLASEKAGCIETSGLGLGAALWSMPGAKRPGFITRTRYQLADMQSIGFERYTRIQAGIREIFVGDSAEPRYGLTALGVEPECQGRGIGSTLIRPVLERCDREGIPAGLVCSKERNVPFYEMHGFCVTREHTLPDHGPTVWRMWRPPR